LFIKENKMNKKLDKNKDKMIYFWKKFLSKTGCFILKKRVFLVFMIILSTSGYCLYIWYRYVYKPDWDNSRKESYIQEKEKGEIFDKNKFKEIIFGGQGKYHLNNGNYKALYAGIWYRNSDATYFNVGLDYASFHFGISYDLNLSSLSVASNHRGGFEFALIYIIQRYKPDIKRYKACPNYI